MRPAMIVTLLGLGLAVAGVVAGFGSGVVVIRPKSVRPADVPAGDVEYAWMHTTTNGVTWERFVAGLARVPQTFPGVHVDDTKAFVESTTASPEVVLSHPGKRGRVRFRWYKMTNDARAEDWVAALARRSPAPVAFIGGGSTDRAVELAVALQRQESWQGPRPLLCITTATADECTVGETGFEHLSLVKLYPERTFRFCFTNSRIAESVVDFLWQTPDLTPAPGESRVPLVPSVIWNDDPFSVDLHARFAEALARKGAGVVQQQVPFSVGRMNTPNAGEALAAEGVREIAERQPGRTLVMLPTVTNPARRLLLELLARDPALAGKLVVATGDGIPVNALIRDATFAWPAGRLRVPLVVFCHNDPTDWESPGPVAYRVESPNATEEVKHFALMGRILTEAAFRDDARPDANGLRRQFHNLTPPFFAADGERAVGTGEYIAALRPQQSSALLTVYRRDDARWQGVRETVIAYRRGE